MLRLLEIPKDILVFEKYPILNQIWGIVSTEYAKDATLEWQTTEDSGSIYFILLDDEVIGITGYWVIDDTYAGLRWHGIIPTYRKQGLSTVSLKLLFACIPKNISVIYEIANNDKTARYFESIGFNRVTDETLRTYVCTSSGEGNIGENIVLKYEINVDKR